MTKFKSVKNKVVSTIDRFLEIIIPEDLRLKKILKIEENDLRTLLPRANVFLDNVFVLFDYQNDIVKLLVKSIKYKNNRQVKKIISKYLYEELVMICSDINIFEGTIPVLIPMPMSKKEKKERGYNQCEEMVLQLEKLNNNNFIVDYENLIKIRETKRQTELNRKERTKNVCKSMEIKNGEKIRNKTIIVFDDVFTTLSTFNEARRVLAESGAKKVIGLFIAH